MPEISRRKDPADQLAEMEFIKTFPFGDRTDKVLSRAVCEFYGVRYSTNGDGYQDACYYPYYEHGEIVDYKKRVYPKSMFTVTGKIKSAQLFGEQTVPENHRGFLIITEGEDDCLAAKEMLWQMGKSYHVVSVQNGANEDGTLDRTLLKRIEFIESFKSVAICFDNDEAGKNTAAALAELIAPQCNVRLVKLPEGIKDAYDLKSSKAIQNPAQVFLQCLWNASTYTPEDIIEGQDISLDFLITPSLPGYALAYPVLQDRLHGLRKAEITLLTAGTGIGKTTLAREINYTLMEMHGLRIGNVFLEEQWKKTAQGYIAIDNNVPLPLLRVNPNIITREQWQRSYDKMFTSGQLNFIKHFGSIDSELLIRKMRYMALVLKCDFITLDHITMTHSGKDVDERKDIDILMTRMAELVTETGVGILPIVHLKRKPGDVNFNEGAEVSITDLRGSSQLEALSFNIIAAERNQQSTTVSDILTLRVLKNREWGFLGLCDKLAYSHHTGRLLPFEMHQQL